MSETKTIAERCFSVEQCESELFDTVHKILGEDSDQCLKPGFVWEVTNTTTDSYDGSIEVIRPEGRPPMTRQQANAILALGFGIVFESIGDTGRCITAKSDGPCSVHKGDDGLNLKRMKSELEQIRAVFQHGADDEHWKPGTTLAQAVAGLKHENDLLRDNCEGLKQVLLKQLEAE